MKKQNYLMLFTLALAISLACNDSDPEPDPGPQPNLETYAMSDQGWQDRGMARIEFLDPNDLDSQEPTHVNYATAIVNTDLIETELGEGDKRRRLFDLDLNDPTRVLRLISFNLYSPIVVEGGTAADNVLGNANERTFEFWEGDAGDARPTGYFFDTAAFAVLDKDDTDNIRSFFFTGGTVTISGTAPDLTLEFSATAYDDVREIEATLTGSTTGTFRFIEND